LGGRVISRCKLLAYLGYIAFSADLFSNWRQMTKGEEAMAMIANLCTNPPKLRARARAALTALPALPHMD
jgi:dienelactone hydrolase